VPADLPAHQADLLNVTIRSVEEDTDTFLRYADQPVFAFVMLFNQQRSAAGEDDMRALTQELIDASLEAGGRYYLPYRLHATPEQFAAAYPQGAEFFALKRKYDPGELFQNEFYRTYGR
jgi:FAD/FMN-containing dehydrogenase